MISFNFDFASLSKKGKLLGLLPVAAFGVMMVSMFSFPGRGQEYFIFGLIHEIGLLIAGVFLFGYGFHEIRKKRMIDNTPTSKIRSVAMGLCEISGLAKMRGPLKSPVTFTDCAFYKFKIEKLVRGSKGRSHWQTIKEGCSANYFYVDDGTGKLLVDPLEAEPMLVADYCNTASEGTSFLTSQKLRKTEWYIKEGDFVYVIGTVRKFVDAARERGDKLNERLRKLKEDRARLLAEFDTDKDGQISVEEWDKAREKVEQDMMNEELNQPADPQDDLVIAKGDMETTFILCDRDEKTVASSLGWKGYGLSCAGGLLIVVMCMSMLARTALLPRFLAIPWQVFYR